MKRDIRVLAVLMRWGYGRPEMGPSTEPAMFLEPLTGLCREVRPFWYDEYMSDPALLERKLQECAEDYAPDLIFFTTYQDQFRPEFLDRLKSRFKTVAWFGDDQWRFENYTRRYARHFSTCITTDSFAVAKYEALGANVILSQWAVDNSLGVREPLPPDGAFLYDVSFVGARNEVRSWFARLLQKQGIAVACFGPKWPSGFLPYEQIAEIFQRSRINLNFSNSVQQDIRFIFGGARNFARWIRSRKRCEQMKARNFEIPLAGGFELSHYAPSLERYLDIGKEVGIFTSPEDCAQQIRYYLDNPQERYEMAVRAHKRTVAEHTFVHRFETILNRIFGGIGAEPQHHV